MLRMPKLEEEPLISPRCDIEGAHEGLSGSSKSFWGTLTFGSIKLVMDKGVTKQLAFEDLLPLPYDMDPSSCHKVLLMTWEAQLANGCSDPSLLKAIFLAYGWPYLRLAFLKVFSDCLGFAGPLLLNRLIHLLEQGCEPVEGFLVAASLGITSLLKSILDTQYTYRISKLKLMLRSSIMTVVYQKCLNVSLVERSKFSEGEIQTFMSVDADRTVNLCNSFNDMWSLPLQIGVALYLLYTQVDFAFVSGVAITILLIPANNSVTA